MPRHPKPNSSRVTVAPLLAKSEEVQIEQLLLMLYEARQRNTNQDASKSLEKYTEALAYALAGASQTRTQLDADPDSKNSGQYLCHLKMLRQVKIIVQAALQQLDENYEQAQELLEDLIQDAELDCKHTDRHPTQVEQVARFYLASIYCGVSRIEEAKAILNSIISFSVDVSELSPKAGKGRERISKRYEVTLTEHDASPTLPLFLWEHWAVNNLADCYERLAVEERRSVGTDGFENLQKVVKNLVAAKAIYEKAVTLHEAKKSNGASPIALYIPLHNQGRVAYQLAICNLWERDFSEKMPELGGGRYGVAALHVHRAIKHFSIAQKTLEDAKMEAHDEEAYFWEAIVGRDLGTVHFRRATRTPRKSDWPDVSESDYRELDKAQEMWDEAQSSMGKFAKLSPGVSNLVKDKAALIRAKSSRLRHLLDDLKGSRYIRLDSDTFRLLEWLPDCDMLPDGYSSPEEQIITEIMSKDEDIYVAYTKHDSRKPEEEEDKSDVLVVLRDWASATPLLSAALNDGCGGGYFIRWKGNDIVKGIVIDPGFDFLDNFQRAGFFIEEIDHIIISHNHDDHRFDFYALDNLCYELHKRDKNPDKFGYRLIADKDTLSDIEGHFDKTLGHKDPAQMLSKRGLYIVKGQKKAEINLPDESDKIPSTNGDPKFKVHFFKADHNPELENALSFRLDCEHLVGMDSKGKEILSEDGPKIGYTADTVYSANYRKLAQEYLCESNILIAHISQPDVLELLDYEGGSLTSQTSKRFKVHLGYTGVKKIIEDTMERHQSDLSKAPLILIGEFWPGLGDIRISIIRALTRRFPKLTILPASNGLQVKLKSRDVRCSQCLQWIAGNLVSVAPPSKPYGSLHYLCPRCRVPSQQGDSL